MNGPKSGSHLPQAALLQTLLLVSLSAQAGVSVEPMPLPAAPLTVALSEERIDFNISGLPGLYEADRPITISVDPPFGNWVVFCQGEPLRGPRGLIPPDRIFVSQQRVNPDGTPEPGFEFTSVEELRLVAEGMPSDQQLPGVSTLRFQLLTTWEDEPGTYIGAIKFTYLVRP